LIFGCSNISHLSIVSTKNYSPLENYESIGQISAKGESRLMWLYVLLNLDYKNTAIGHIIDIALKESGADYITNVNIYEKEMILLFWGSKSIEISGEGWKKIDNKKTEINLESKIKENKSKVIKTSNPVYNPNTGELLE